MKVPMIRRKAPTVKSAIKLLILLLATAATSASLTALADNPPTVITTREGLAAITNNLAGFYALGADIDLGGAEWTHAAEYPVDSATGPCLPDFDPVPSNMFFKYRIAFEYE